MTTAEKLLKIDEGVEETIALNAELEQTLYGTDTDKTLSENVEQTANDFQAIKDKIVEHGVEVADGTRTAEYASKVDNVYEAGKKAEYDEFWDEYQDNGNRINYLYAFAGFGWNDKNYNPKYPIRTTQNSQNLYSYSLITDTKVTIDQSAVTANGGGMFTNATSMVTIRKLIVCPRFSMASSFQGCNKLQSLTIEGEVGGNINLQWSPLLSHDSIVSVMTKLSTTATGRTATFSKTAVNNAFETSAGLADGSTSTEWTTLIGTKTNWTISLV